MAIPDFQSIMLPFLETLQDSQVRTTSEVTDKLADRFKLTDEERQELMQSGQTHFYNRVAWAKTHLKYAGLIDNPTRGKVSISDEGLKVLSQKPPIVNCKFLKQYPSYLEFIGQAPGTDRKDGVGGKGENDSTKTPEQSLEESYQTIRETLAVEVLDRVKSCSPQFFERLVVQLLVKMGYGGSLADAGKAIGKAGDGGIDGIIKEDQLGLDVICLQAKRWENPVGSKTVREFHGSMALRKARKGVLLTTSTFTKDAKECAEDLKIILIDGQLLAKLMIDHNVGMFPIKSYELKKLDQDYFEDEGV